MAPLWSIYHFRELATFFWSTTPWSSLHPGGVPLFSKASPSLNWSRTLLVMWFYPLFQNSSVLLLFIIIFHHLNLKLISNIINFLSVKIKKSPSISSYPPALDAVGLNNRTTSPSHRPCPKCVCITRCACSGSWCLIHPVHVGSCSRDHDTLRMCLPFPPSNTHIRLFSLTIIDRLEGRGGETHSGLGVPSLFFSSFVFNVIIEYYLFYLYRKKMFCSLCCIPSSVS